ncbi:MAG: hypothetical protein RBS05_01250 [Zoogloea oleivorans]|jgi:hypothetical protein|nr:hypothetical protein [Zoogloea oleivorans]
MQQPTPRTTIENQHRQAHHAGPSLLEQWHWRMICLDQAHRPLAGLERLTAGRPEWRPVMCVLIQQLARADMGPGEQFHEVPYSERRPAGGRREAK